jgi:hypothetical protein
MTTNAVATSRPRHRWLRRLLIAGATMGGLGSAAMYVSYRMMFRKNPEVVREMRAAEQRQ